MLFREKVAIVTGGASGIGRAAAVAFAREGACVMITDIDAVGGEIVARQIIDAGGLAIFQQADVSAADAVARMVQRTVHEFGRLDAAFNNAGMPGDQADAATYTEDGWNRIVEINMKSVWLCMKYEIAEMLKHGGGAIVNTASRAGDSAAPHMFGYVATKHGVVGMSRSAALDFAARNIRVNALLPGYTHTPMMERAGKDAGLPDLAVLGEAAVPMKRLGTAEEQAEAAIWLCSHRASYVTGIALAVDGGMSAAL